MVTAVVALQIGYLASTFGPLVWSPRLHAAASLGTLSDFR